MPLPRRSPVRERVAAVAVLTVVLLVVALIGRRPAASTSSADRPADRPAAATVTAATADASVSTTNSVTTKAGAPSTTGSEPPAPAGRVALPALPAGGTFDGGRPPQFVLVSFDGAVDPDLLARWESVAARSPAHLSFFLSAVYLLGHDVTKSYQGPGHAAGSSAIGFVPNRSGQPDNAFLQTAVAGLRATQAKGNELGNHYGGHWCGASGVSTWKAADWAAELNAVENLVGNVDANNHLDPAVGAPYNPIEVAGSRTPCLEGNLDALYPVLAARGYRYDASNTKGLDDWPRQRKGLWAFGFPAVAIPGLDHLAITVDFSLSTAFGGSAAQKVLPADKAKEVSADVLQGYLAAFDHTYYGSRAPIEISNHFTHSDSDAYNNAVEQFMVKSCAKPEVQCVTYSELADWLDAHADKLGSIIDKKFPALAHAAG